MSTPIDTQPATTETLAQETSEALPPVILLHGLHMHAWTMMPLAKRLADQGFDCDRFGYYSVWHRLATHSQRLDDWLSRHYRQDQPLYLVGHSLGGLVIRDFLYRYPAWQVPRCVTIGTPHTGSQSAERIIRHIPSFIGRSYVTGLDGKAPPLKAGVELGSIAGTLSAGLGQLVLPKNSTLANDGTVFVQETVLAGVSPEYFHHCVVHASHTGMIFDAAVAKQVGYFLKNGYFLPSH